MDKTELLKKAINTYGVQAQKDMMIEEMSELTKAILKERRVDNFTIAELAKDNIREEIVDVQIMLNQMKIIYGYKLEWENRKLQRLSDKINREAKSCLDIT